MTHQELLSITIIVHVAVLSGSLPAWFKYGIGSDFMAKSLEGTEATLSKIRIMISNYLLCNIKEFLYKDTEERVIRSNLQPILGPDGKSFFYSEKGANFLESDGFQQVINDFIYLRVDMVTDYQVLMRARANWCFWAGILSWSILVLIVLQILFLTLHGFIDKIMGYSLPDWCNHASLSITGFIVISVFCVLFPFLLRSHNLIIQQKVKYDAPQERS